MRPRLFTAGGRGQATMLLVLTGCLAASEREAGQRFRDCPECPEIWDGDGVTLTIYEQRFRDCPECPEMVVVPTGSFLMGAPESESKWGDAERPVHSVSVRSFAVGVYEVTFSEWDACVSGGGCDGYESYNRKWGRFDHWWPPSIEPVRGYRPDDEGWGRGRRPVINVSWDDAQLYVHWLSDRAGHRYRLLSESEWEYAARAGTTGPFHTGSTISPDQAYYEETWFCHSEYPWLNLCPGKTVQVGLFPANGFGLHDMHGGVMEWVQDCWNGNYKGAPSDGEAWESGDCSRRMLRGGSWSFGPEYLRSANRTHSGTGRRDNDTGFRVARTLTP